MNILLEANLDTIQYIKLIENDKWSTFLCLVTKKQDKIMIQGQ
jgi:hypothetical protein